MQAPTIQQILLRYWGFSHFRSLQEEVIQSVMDGKDTLALLPTGGGKSICFQVPALAKEGICIVVTPLIALMKDQVERLQDKGIKAMAIHSALSRREVDIAFDNCIYGNFKFLYLSPERLETEMARIRIPAMKVNLLAIDEAHCISQWGFDFRPSYRKIAALRELLPKVPVLALTATATPEVASDIQKQLGFKKENLMRKSFERKNLSYQVYQEEDKLNRLLKIVQKEKGSGLIYVRSRKKAQDIAQFLHHYKVPVDYYHAGLTAETREQKQESWIENRIRIMVCTNAFGMGIDKPDVRLVIHYDLPDCPEAYFQEAGRAGRDEKAARAILLYNGGDKRELERQLEISFPPLEEIRRVYQALCNYFQIPVGAGPGAEYEFDIHDLCQRYELNSLTTFSALKILEREGYLVLSEGVLQRSRVHLLLNRDNLYKFQVENQAYDEFLKLLLRSYTGLFDQYGRISETDLARRGEMKAEKVRELLNDLVKLEVLSYLPQTDKPRILFLEPRIEAKNVVISEEALKKRKERARMRADAILHYAESRSKCRSQILLSYFGEKEVYRCGICDVCLDRNQLDMSSLEFEKVSGQVKHLLTRQPTALEALVARIEGSTEEKALRVIRWLLEHEKIIKDESNLLSWHS